MNYDVKETVTIILHFNDYQLNDLKNTIGSVLLYTDMKLVEEIIVVDDASSLDHIVKDAVQYFKVIPKVRYLRNRSSDQAGTARVRTTAAKEAKTGVLVFLDSWAICSKGWLEPLVDALAKDPNAIVTPHFDRIHDPVSLDYVVERKHQIFSVSWNLAIRGRPSPEIKTSNGYYHSPAVRGNVFAVRKDFFFAVGAYDTGLDGDGGGEQVELSIRAWLCTGSVKVAYCSRVGLLNLFDPVKVSSQRNVRRIAEKWFGAQRSTVYRSFGMATKSGDDQIFDLGSDRTEHTNRLIGQCKDIDWFLTHIATNMVAPSLEAVHFGILRVKTDRCSRLLPAFDRVKLDDCKQEHFVRYRSEMLFELTAGGYLKVMGKCLTTKDNAYILAEKCRPGDTKQQWRYKNEELVNVWCNFCGMHVTDPDPRMEGDRQILMAQECNSDGSNGGLFKKWEFLMP